MMSPVRTPVGALWGQIEASTAKLEIIVRLYMFYVVNYDFS